MIGVMRCPRKQNLEGFSQNMGNDFVKTRFANEGTAKFRELNALAGARVVSTLTLR